MTVGNARLLLAVITSRQSRGVQKEVHPQRDQQHIYCVKQVSSSVNTAIRANAFMCQEWQTTWLMSHLENLTGLTHTLLITSIVLPHTNRVGK
jgi:hypothetical protein